MRRPSRPLKGQAAASAVKRQAAASAGAPRLRSAPQRGGGRVPFVRAAETHGGAAASAIGSDESLRSDSAENSTAFTERPDDKSARVGLSAGASQSGLMMAKARSSGLCW